MAEIPYRTLVWLTYRLGATFAVGLPLALFIWAVFRKETALVRLLSIYWKISSLMAISILLLTGERPIGYLTSFLAPLLMIGSVWFWIDLNEELADLPAWRPLPFTIRIWRWALTSFGVLSAMLSSFSLSCMELSDGAHCSSWMEAPQRFHIIFKNLFQFLFGANWTEGLAAFVGYLALIAYFIGLLQWIFIRVPKQGRIAGDF